MGDHGRGSPKSKHVCPILLTGIDGDIWQVRSVISFLHWGWEDFKLRGLLEDQIPQPLGACRVTGILTLYT